jgi:DNA polymerase
VAPTTPGHSSLERRVTVFADSETFSWVPLSKGLLNYADQSEILIFTYAFDDGPVQLWQPDIEPMPEDLRAAIERGERFVFHNSQFDRTLLRANGVWIPVECIHDTMIQAFAHGLPGQLEELCRVFGLTDEAKSKAGKQLIHLFCKPNKKGQRNTRDTHPKQWDEFCVYAKQDVVAMRALYRLLPRWNYPDGSDYQVWLLDQRINDRGVAMDLELARAAIAAAADTKEALDADVVEATDGDVQAATQRDLLLKHIAEAYGVTLPDMRADTLQRRIEDESLPLELRQLLALRVQSSRNTASKYTAILEMTASDGRLHHSLQFCGAPTTGRWSGRKPQFQNLMRPTMAPNDIDEAIGHIKSGHVTMLYRDVAQVLGNAVRGTIIAPPGRKLIAADLSSIEGRMLAWLAREQFILDFYRDVDMGLVAYDSYMLAYAMCFGVDPASVIRKQRQIGKPIELAFGYGGGVAAFLNFAMVYHLDLQEVAEAVWATGDKKFLVQLRDEKYEWAKSKRYHAGLDRFQYSAFEYTKLKWRDARPLTVKFWADLATAFGNAVRTEKKIYSAGPIQFLRTGQWLRMRLPSGRQLCFLQPRNDAKGLSYAGVNKYTRKWGRVSTHGGKLAGIATQAAASDVLRAALPRLEAEQYETVMSIHDEGICEVPDSPLFTAERMSELLTMELPWAPGLPLAADGFETYRYRKGE